MNKRILRSSILLLIASVLGAACPAVARAAEPKVISNFTADSIPAGPFVIGVGEKSSSIPTWAT